MTSFFDIAPCSLFKVHKHFRGVSCFHRNQMMEVLYTSEMSLSMRLHGTISQKFVIFILAPLTKKSHLKELHYKYIQIACTYYMFVIIISVYIFPQIICFYTYKFCVIMIGYIRSVHPNMQYVLCMKGLMMTYNICQNM
jgi:hypothetical protein